MVQRDRLAIVATTHDQTLLDLADEVHEMHDGNIRALRSAAGASADDMFKRPAARPQQVVRARS